MPPRRTAAFLLTYILLTVPAQAGNYTFESLVAGPLNGQDNWVATSNARIEPGVGVNVSRVFNNDTSGLPEAVATRVNNAAFGFPSQGAGRAVLGFDFRVDDPQGAAAIASLVLAESGQAPTPQGRIGVKYNATFDQLLVLRADESAYAGGASNFAHTRGHWYRAAMRIDFAAHAGNASGSVFIKNLTANTPFAPVAALQDIDLLIAAQGIDPARWDRMDLRAANAQVDNLRVEPFTDCNTNAIPDADDVSDCNGSNDCSDCNTNAIPDVCESDADTNGTVDACEPGCSTCHGDINGDLRIDGSDIAGYSRCFLGVAALGDSCPCADTFPLAAGDGVIDGGDLAAFTAKLLADADTACP